MTWIRRHRGLTAFAAGVLVSLLAVAGVGYLVLADQRRSARVLSAAVSQALAREVRIDRVTEVAARRIVMQGIHLPTAGGWPADLTAERVEVTGPLLAAARGDQAPLGVVVTRPSVALPPVGSSVGLTALDGLRQGLVSFLGASTLLDVTLTGGTVRAAEGAGVTFDLTLRKTSGAAAAELSLRDGSTAPLILTADARMDGQTARLTLAGQGPLAPVSGWLPSAGGMRQLAGESLAFRLDVDAPADAPLGARGRLALGDAVGLEGEATLRDGVLQATFPRIGADLGLAGDAVGLRWHPRGRGELTDVRLIWRREAGPTLTARMSVPRLEVRDTGGKTGVVAEGFQGDVTVEPGPDGLAAHGAAQVMRLGAARLEMAPARARYRLTLDPRRALSRIDLDGLALRIAGATLEGGVAYDAVRQRLDARLGAEEADVAGLVRAVAPGWLGSENRLRATGLRLTVTGLDPAGLGAGAIGLETQSLVLRGSEGELASGGAAARATLSGDNAVLTLQVTGLRGSIPFFRGTLARLGGSLELTRAADDRFEPRRGELTAWDAQGGELVTVTLREQRPERVLVSARAPDLGRLGGLWPDLERKVAGSARLDATLGGPRFQAAEGRLTLAVPDAELFGGKLALHDLSAEVPFQRGPGLASEPPWGALRVEELICYGLVARDLTTPVRVFKDRLSLNDLAYALYSGIGKGWAEVEREPTGLFARASVSGNGVRIEEFVSAYGIRGGTMTGLLRYDLAGQYRAGHVTVNGRLEVPEGGTVNIELLDRLLVYADADPTGVLRSTLQHLRAFDYKFAEAEVRSAVGGDLLVNLSLRGREQFGILPPRVREINVRNLPVSFLARQFPGR